MSIFIKDIWLVAQRELRHYFRDPHVLIYSVLLPALLYPTAVVLMIEGSLWQESLAEKRGIRVALPQPLAAKDFEAALRKNPSIKIVSAIDPVKALQNAEVDAVIRSGADDTIEILTPPKVATEVSSPRSKLELLVDDFKRESVKELLSTKGYQPEQMNSFLMKQTNVSSVATSLTTIVPYTCCLALMIMSLGAIYPAIAAFTEERRRKPRIDSNDTGRADSSGIGKACRNFPFYFTIFGAQSCLHIECRSIDGEPASGTVITIATRSMVYRSPALCLDSSVCRECP